MESFRRLGLIDPIVKVIQEQGFTKPSDIQEQAIPLTLEGRDIIAGSATGSGKTLAFAASVIQHTERGKGVQALILTPTRELAEQVSEAIKLFSKYKPINVMSVYGGVSINPQMDKLPFADVVVGTPGRILDHMERETIDLRNIKILVLDEADRMLDMGFIDDVRRIISALPKKRQTLLFSATMEGGIGDIADQEMNDPVKVTVDNQVDPTKLNQVYYDTPENVKFSLLVHLLKNEQSGLVMVFCNTQHTTDFVANNLKKNDIDAMAIHGGFSQQKRNRTLEDFHTKTAHVLVCTDVAARGLDIESVSHVYNYNAPNEEKQYIHRIGRTARAGKEGKVINLISHSDHENFDRILRFARVDVSKEEIPEIERIPIKWHGERRGGFGGGRGFGSRGQSGGGYGRSSDSGDRRPSYGGPRRGSDGRRSHSDSRPRYGSQGGNRNSGSRGGNSGSAGHSASQTQGTSD